MGIHSGKFAAVNGRSTLRNWSINKTSDLKRYVASNTKGASGRRRGNLDWTGQWSAYGGYPGVMPGENFEFSGYTAPGDDTEGGNGPVYTGNALVDSVAVNFNWEAGDIISHTVNFGANGPLVQSSSALSDTTTPDVPSIIEIPVMYDMLGGGSGATELCDIVSATLNILSDNKTYVNSCTDGQTYRKAGPIDFNVALVMQNDDIDGLPFDIGDSLRLSLFVDDTNYWDLEWCMVKEFTGIQVDRETGNIIQMTINLEMNGFDPENDGTGHIKLPGGSQWWPVLP